MSDPRTDRAVLTGSQHADGRNLRARAAIYQWQTPQVDFPQWAVDQLPWEGIEQVLDLGCGYGAYLGPLGTRAKAVIGVDLSLGMLREAAGGRMPLANADAVGLRARAPVLSDFWRAVKSLQSRAKRQFLAGRILGVEDAHSDAIGRTCQSAELVECRCSARGEPIGIPCPAERSTQNYAAFQIDLPASRFTQNLRLSVPMEVRPYSSMAWL